LKKLIALFDVHIPYNINLDPVFEFIGDFKPNIVVLGGDAHDFTSLSSWVSDQSRNLDGGTIKANYLELHQKLLTPPFVKSSAQG